MITEDRVERLLRETFQAHEHLADAPPARTPSVRRSARLLVAAAAVTAVALGCAYGGIVWLQRENSSLGIIDLPGGKELKPPAGRVLRTDAENRVGTRDLVEQAMRSGGQAIHALPGGARSATADDVPGLKHQNMSIGGGNQIQRSAFFLATDADTKALASYVAAHPPTGFTTDGYEPGEPNAGVGGSSNLDGSWSDFVDWESTNRSLAVPGGVSLLVQLTPTGTGTGIRLTAFGTWFPARPLASYLDAPVTSIDVSYTPGQNFGKPHGRAGRVTLTKASQIDRIVSSYNQLNGWPESYHSCPFMGTPDQLVAVFHMADHDLSLSWNEGCYAIWTVSVAGHRVRPYLSDALDLRDRLVALTR